MTDQENEKWFDELISRTINTKKPHFDPEKWRQKFPEEFQILASRTAKRSPHTSDLLPGVWRLLFRSPVAKLAVAAVIIVAIGLVVTYLGPGKPVAPPNGLVVGKSPAEMMNVMSLTIAYRRGGMEAVDEQCERAIRMLGPRPLRLTLGQLLTENNG